MAYFGVLTIIALAYINMSTATSSTTEKVILKRGIPLYSDIVSPLSGGLSQYTPAHSFGAWLSSSKSYGPSPSEVANAIAAAKQASANVVIAQQQVQAAKDNVLHQQKLAMDKETAAAILTQKSETAAAVQRSEAAAAAQAVVLAQQRFAAAKAAVAHQQRIAAAKEAEAAAALQSSAHAAAVEIQRTENEASKFSNLQRTGAAAAAHHVAATKDAALAPLTSGSNHIPNAALTWPITHGGTVVAATDPWISAIPISPVYSGAKSALAYNHIWG